VPDPLAAPGTGLEAFAMPAVAGNAGPTRSELRRRWSFSLGFCALWLVAQVLSFGLRHDWAEMPARYLGPLVVLPFAAGGLSIALARAGGRLGLGLRPSTLALWGALSLVTPLALGFLLTPPVNMVGSARNHLICVLMVLGWSVPPLLVLSSVVRRSFVARERLRSAHLAAAAGLLAATIANLHCALVESAHVALAHGLPVSALAVLGALFLAPRARS
jgi:hypothetical protein